MTSNADSGCYVKFDWLGKNGELIKFHEILIFPRLTSLWKRSISSVKTKPLFIATISICQLDRHRFGLGDIYYNHTEILLSCQLRHLVRLRFTYFLKVICICNTVRSTVLVLYEIYAPHIKNEQ